MLVCHVLPSLAKAGAGCISVQVRICAGGTGKPVFLPRPVLELHIGEFTKSRARRTNDNALAESKNASVVRKWLGYAHIPQRFAGQVNAFNRDWLSPFLNYHRPCLFPTEECDDKGRVRKRYRDADTMTPYDKFKSLDDVEQYLLPGVTFEQLDNAALAVSDVQAAEALNQAREELFRSLKQADTAA